MALLASVAAAGFTGWYAWDTHGMRADAREAANKQAEDVKSARAAAEKSAAAAQRSASAAEKLAAAMKKSAEAAEKSAHAGLQALALNKRALVLSNIPVMEVFNARLLKAVAPGVVPTITTKVYNAGKGTAYEFTAQQWLTVAPSRAFTYDTSQSLPSTTDVAPGPQHIFQMTIKYSSPLTEEQVRSIETQHLMLYTYGMAVYYDNTLEKHKKYTWFWCSYYSPIDDGSDKLLLGVCPEHNYTKVE